MAKVTVDLPLEGVKALVLQLSLQDLLAVWTLLRERLETLQMTTLAESAFAEWEAEPELYGHG